MIFYENDCVILEASMFKAGTAIADISPDQGLPLAGYPRHPRNNLGIHDPLYASCLFLDDGNTKIEIICMDVAGYSKESVRAVREGIAKETGIPAGNIMICCSHTHSGPWTSSWLDLDDYEHPLGPDPKYAAFLQRTLIALGINAAKRPFEARIGIDKTFCGKEKGIGGNRRNPNEAADPEVWVIGVKDASGLLRACLAKYALHPTFIHSDSFLVSADYPGYMRKHLGEKYPEMMFMFAQGTSGNQSPRFFRSGKTFAEAERAGRTIGNAVLEVLSSMESREDAALGVFSEYVEIDTRQLPSFADAEAASKKYRALWDEAKRRSSSERDVWIAELKSLGADCVRAYSGIKEKGSWGSSWMIFPARYKF
jgi:hypothetical protein